MSFEYTTYFYFQKKSMCCTTYIDKWLRNNDNKFKK